MLLITNINASFLHFGLILFAYLHLETVKFNVWFQQNIFQSCWDSQMHEWVYVILCSLYQGWGCSHSLLEPQASYWKWCSGKYVKQILGPVKGNSGYWPFSLENEQWHLFNGRCSVLLHNCNSCEGNELIVIVAPFSSFLSLLLSWKWFMYNTNREKVVISVFDL